MSGYRPQAALSCGQGRTEVATHHIGADEALTSSEQDEYGMVHVAKRAAQLVHTSHSQETSIVVGVIGPWGSGKTSVTKMCCAELSKLDPNWAIGHFTPWATSDITSMLADFYKALAGAMPGAKASNFRQSLGRVAVAGSPALKMIPLVGDAAAELTAKAGSKLVEQPSWDAAFAEAGKQLQELETPVLIVVDDVDRLHGDELANLLKVVRLLGRFPGVSYLLAYDEETVFANLPRREGDGQSSQRAARVFMEKIVQYPLAVPPLLPEQILESVDTGLTRVLAGSGHIVGLQDHRVSRMDDVFVSQLRTPRAINRFLAQVSFTLSMHDPGEIDGVDVILMTLLRIQFPVLYSELPRWKSELAGSKSSRRLMRDISDIDRPITYERLFELVPEGYDREDAEELVAAIFPATSRYSSRDGTGQRADSSDYFDRYFVNTVPQGDIADADIRRALVQAGTPGEGRDLLHAMVARVPSQRVYRTLRRLRDTWQGEHEESVEPITLLGNVMSLWDCVSGQTGEWFEPRDRLRWWASEILAGVGTEVSEDQVVTALTRNSSLFAVLQVVWGARKEASLSQPTKDSASKFALEGLDTALKHLMERDKGSYETPVAFLFMVLAEFARTEEYQGRVQSTIEDVGLDTFASRFVSVINSPTEPSRGEFLGFDQETFARFAPGDDPLYTMPKVSPLDGADVSWANRRAYVRGRVSRPERAADSSENDGY